jgi:hypothetical protein
VDLFFSPAVSGSEVSEHICQRRSENATQQIYSAAGSRSKRPDSISGFSDSQLLTLLLREKLPRYGMLC